MSRYRFAISTLVMATSLSIVPRDAAAGMVDVIIEMSGPQLWGFGFEFKQGLFDSDNNRRELRVLEYPKGFDVDDSRPADLIRLDDESERVYGFLLTLWPSGK